MTRFWWLSSRRMTVGVYVRDGYVVGGAPIVARFVGQPLDNLTRWMARQPGPLLVRCLDR